MDESKSAVTMNTKDVAVAGNSAPETLGPNTTDEEEPDLKESRPENERTLSTDPHSDGTWDQSTSSAPEPAAIHTYQGYCPFLNLSAELRNRIYEEALLGQEVIVIDKDLREPALLQTNRQIRAEARAMWYNRNKFETVIQHCDIRLLHKWNTLVMPEATLRSNGTTNDSDVTLVYVGRHDWANLMWWCWAVHQRKFAESMPLESRESPTQKVIFAALDVAVLGRGGSWAMCKQTLAVLREAFGEIDRTWLEGGDGPDDE